MGSPVNLQYEWLRSLEINKRTVTGTYTVRTGRDSDFFVVDNPVDVADPAADFTLTVPSGVRMGQQLLVVMSSNDDSKTCSISVTNHETSDPEVFTNN